MTEAERHVRQMLGLGEQLVNAFAAADGHDRANFATFHPQVVHSLFGPSGTKEMLVGKEAFAAFVSRCRNALADYSDEILLVRAIDEQCVFVHARAYRKSAASQEEITYEWAMLYRVEDGLITYGADMLDADAQAFWGRVQRV